MSVPLPARPERAGSLLDLLDLEPLDRDLFRATSVVDEPLPLYGGQVAAQALHAAGQTVPDGRVPHSLHGYYLRGGDASHATLFRVDRDRDGRSFSARRVVAVQRGEVIFNMSVSFHAPEDGLDRQVDPVPDAGDPEALPPLVLPRLISMEGRVPEQPYPVPEEPDRVRWPTRFWSRCTAELPDDPLVHASVLTYLSDILTGLSALHEGDWHSGSSLDHAVYFHRPVRMDRWVLIDLVPRTVAGGRGWYTGTVHDQDGVLAASVTQEALFREGAQWPRAARAAGDGQ
jgi:acyl-CoA thioesterase-2